ncbi:Annexin [Spironucleus salmonicida]|uniref:Annexin n=1 Tax=Spironucleus salmonicida TaxID=348837 RepID=V6LZS9_9EUKA|nr:Annexin [Spironucleus salmonicida]|eukprot:EST49256.1 Annexin [Spironucleus salmonicida]
MPQIVRYAQLSVDEAKCESAAQQLNIAMEGRSNDKVQMISITRQLNAEERFVCAKIFQQKFGKSLLTVLKDELSGDLEDFFIVCYSGFYNQWAQFVYDSMKGKKIDQVFMAEILFMMTFDDLKKVTVAYTELFGADMKADVLTEVAGTEFHALFLSWFESGNIYGGDIEKIVDYMVDTLTATDFNARIVNILTKCHSRVYRQVQEPFKQRTGDDFINILKKKYDAKNEKVFMECHYALLNQQEFIARQLMLAFKGAGTDEDKMMRVTQLYSDRLHGDSITQAYAAYGDIEKTIKADLSGKSEDLVLALWGF